jgi:hypothetical protein
LAAACAPIPTHSEGCRQEEKQGNRQEQNSSSKIIVLTSKFFELLRQFSVLFLQGEEAPANLRQVPNNGLKKAEQKINPQIMIQRASLSVNT